MAKIQSMTLARLVNTGDYEHQRYELTVGIEPSDDPGAVFVLIQELLADMAAQPPHGEWAIREAKRIIADPEATPAEVADEQKVLDAVQAYKARKAGIAARLRGLGGFTVKGTGEVSNLMVSNQYATLGEANMATVLSGYRG